MSEEPTTYYLVPIHRRVEAEERGYARVPATSFRHALSIFDMLDTVEVVSSIQIIPIKEEEWELLSDEQVQDG